MVGQTQADPPFFIDVHYSNIRKKYSGLRGLNWNSVLYLIHECTETIRAITMKEKFVKRELPSIILPRN